MFRILPTYQYNLQRYIFFVYRLTSLQVYRFIKKKGRYPLATALSIKS